MTSKEKNFWKTLLANGETNTISSKRLAMLISLLMLVALAIASACGYNCSPEFTYIFGSIVAAESGLTVIEKGKEKIKKVTKGRTRHSDCEDEEEDQ